MRLKIADAENVFASIMTRRNVKLVWPARRFHLPSLNTTYRPDFYAPVENIYYEVVGTRQAYSANRHKYEAMAVEHPEVTLYFVCGNGQPYTPYEVKPGTSFTTFLRAIGRLGGRRRAQVLTASRRREIATLAAETRWRKAREATAT